MMHLSIEIKVECFLPIIIKIRKKAPHKSWSTESEIAQPNDIYQSERVQDSKNINNFVHPYDKDIPSQRSSELLAS